MNTPITKLSFSEHINGLIANTGRTRTDVVSKAISETLKSPETLQRGMASRLTHRDGTPVSTTGMRLDPALVSDFRAFCSSLGLPIEAVLALAIEGHLATRQPVNPPPECPTSDPA